MTYSKTGYFGYAGGGKDGAIVDMWLASRFTTAPAQDTNPPGSTPDAGPVTTSTTFGGPGAYTITGITTQSDYYVRAQYGGHQYWTECSAGSLTGAAAVSSGTILSYLSEAGISTVVSTTLVVVPPGSFVLPTFTVPASGNIRVTWSAVVSPNGASGGIYFGLISGGVQLGDTQLMALDLGNSALPQIKGVYDTVVTGLTPGSSQTITLGAYVTTSTCLLGGPGTGNFTAIVQAL